MKKFFLLTSLFASALMISGPAMAAKSYKLTIINGGAMPLSPAVVYLRHGQDASSVVGQSATPGFVQLCQTGNPETKQKELMTDSNVKFVTTTEGLIMPGESKTVEIPVYNHKHLSLYFETMYGKTKDLCAVGSVGSHALAALHHGIVEKYVGQDQVLATGQFSDPYVNLNQNPNSCSAAEAATDCLREVSMAKEGGRIRFFSQYLPSFVSFLESKFGAEEVQTLIVPSSGAVRFTLEK